uniref:Galectin n=1 Tax=Caenorhabditis tropicalis TaxID=1561998 RepID=A0A1I7TD56_9PELO
MEPIVTIPNSIAWKSDGLKPMHISYKRSLMNPCPSFNVSGLDPYSIYEMWIKIENMDTKKDPIFVIHHNGPMNGENWMRNVVSFDRLFLSASPKPEREAVTVRLQKAYKLTLLIKNESGMVIEEYRNPLLTFEAVAPKRGAEKKEETVVKRAKASPNPVVFTRRAPISAVSNKAMEMYRNPMHNFIGMSLQERRSVWEEPVVKKFKQPDALEQDSPIKVEPVITVSNPSLWISNGLKPVAACSNGVRMNPCFSFIVSGLDPNAKYEMFIKIEALDNFKYKFGEEIQAYFVNSKDGNPLDPVVVSHGILKGRNWMIDGVSFDHLYLSTSKNPKSEAVNIELKRAYKGTLMIRNELGEVIKEYHNPMHSFVGVSLLERRNMGEKGERPYTLKQVNFF